MRITKDRRRLARKSGWYAGKSLASQAAPENLNKIEPESWPYKELELCLEYEAGFYEGIDASGQDKNPYGLYDKK